MDFHRLRFSLSTALSRSLWTTGSLGKNPWISQGQTATASAPSLSSYPVVSLIRRVSSSGVTGLPGQIRTRSSGPSRGSGARRSLTAGDLPGRCPDRPWPAKLVLGAVIEPHDERETLTGPDAPLLTVPGFEVCNESAQRPAIEGHGCRPCCSPCKQFASPIHAV